MITQAKLNELLEYEPHTGRLYWKVSRGFIRAGAEAGGAFKDYRVITIDSKRYQEHILIWRIIKGVRNPTKPWHMNGVRSANRSANLSSDRPSLKVKSAIVSKDINGFYVSGAKYLSINEALEATREYLCSP